MGGKRKEEETLEDFDDVDIEDGEDVVIVPQQTGSLRKRRG